MRTLFCPGSAMLEALSEILTLFITKGVASCNFTNAYPDRVCFTLLDYFPANYSLAARICARRSLESTMTRVFAFLVFCYAVSLSIQTVLAITGAISECIVSC